MPMKPTVTEQLNSHDDPKKTVTFLTGDSPDEVRTGDFLDQARSVAARMQSRGIGTGDHVALLGPTSRDLTTAIVGTWLAGATVIVMPLPMRLGSIEAFVEATRHRVRKADLSLLLVSDELAGYVVLEPDDPQPVPLGEIVSGPAPPYKEPSVSPDDMAVLQFTSGSTGDPKGVTVTHGAMIANLEGALEAAEVEEGDKIMSWLPLYHDMGLIGVLGVSFLHPLDLVLGAPQDFLSRPRDWLRAISDYQATVTAAPNSAYALAGKILSRSSDEFDLSSWRIALNGAEPVDPDTVEAFVSSGEPSGLRPGTPFPAYGLAEATIAATFPRPGSGLDVDAIDREALETQARAIPGGDLRLTKLGYPVPSIQVRIVDASGAVLGDRDVGEIQLSGPAVTKGYYKDPEATAEVFDGDWFKTGDLGYQVEGQLVVCGRIKDIIIVAGRNCYPQDIERAAEKIDGVRAGNVVAFGVNGSKGRESLIVVAETKLQPDQAEEVARAVATKVREYIGIPVHDVALIKPGTLPKTSSGKVQRSLCRSQYLAGDLDILATAFGADF